MNKIIAYLVLSTLSYSLIAQEMLTLEQAIDKALENNYDIKLEKYNIEISENNVSRAVSGQMPRLEHQMNYELGYSDAEIQTLNISPEAGENPPLELSGSSRELTIQPQLSIPIFNGFSGRYRYKQLENTYQTSELQLTAVIEQTISSTVSTYLEVARLQSRLGIDLDNIALSFDRWQRVKIDATFGAANSVRQLQAEVDLKTDSANYRNVILSYENSRRNLNLIMGQPADQIFTVQEDILLSDELDYAKLENEMKMRNTQLNLSELGIHNATYEVKISEATWFPNISGYTNYTYLDSEDDASFLQSNQVYGPGVGISLSYPLFTGGANKIQRQNAQIRLKKEKTRLGSVNLSLEKDLRNAYAQYANNQQQLRIEKANLRTYEQNFEKVKEDHSLGQVDATDLRTAQLNLSSARNRINDLTYNVKQSEVALLQLTGRLSPKRSDN
ncbi:TolC family protein [Fulvivirga sp. M361]|uniref:TolC family protein n=1 Tax=Fulvivirga sp. M361 TaxID=2594266 RepID=UPI00117B1C42|nr:TolC family protein [Fulvivirga sp. M361]TRX62546.1 TolC family protein [Fulvivirga sp. M361]